VVFHSYVSLPEGNVNLVGGFDHLEKYEFVNGKVDIPYIMEHKKMFETSNILLRGSCMLPFKKDQEQRSPRQTHRREYHRSSGQTVCSETQKQLHMWQKK